MTEPLRVRLNEERHATALAQELQDLARFDLERRDETWEITTGGALGDRGVVRVLNAVRRAHDGETAARAVVFLNGREYELSGE